MRRMAMLLGVGVLGFVLTVGVGVSQEGKKETGKGKMNMLPQGWKALKLTAEQKKKVYDIQNQYRAKIDALEKQIDDLKAKARQESLQVLTEEQRTTLRKSVTGEEAKAPAKAPPGEKKETK